MRFTDRTAPSRPLAVLLSVALIHASVACTAAKGTPLTSTVPPPANDPGTEIVGVTKTDGEALTFGRPAVVEPRQDGNYVLAYQIPIDLSGGNAWLHQSLPLDEISTYDLVTGKDERGVSVVGLAGLVLLGALLFAVACDPISFGSNDAC